MIGRPKGKAVDRLTNRPPIIPHCQAVFTDFCSDQAMIATITRSVVPRSKGSWLNTAVCKMSKLPRMGIASKVAVMMKHTAAF